MLSLLSILYVGALTLTRAQPAVEIVDIFGDVLMQIGKPLTVKCEVSDSESGGVFTWKIGNEIIRSMSSAEEASKEGDRIVDSVRFVPEKKHAGLELRCEYSEGGGLYSDYITANIYLLDLPTSPVTVPQVREGEVASLRLTAGIYPPPQPGNVNWSIRDVAGGQEETLHLQPGDQTGRYQASPLQPLSLPDFYMLSLNISNLDKEEVAKTHELSITTSGTKRTISFELSMRFQPEEPTDPPPIEDNNQLSPKSGGDSGIQVMSNSFVIIIVIVIVIVALLCICCFCYKRNKKEERKEEVLYSPVTTNNTEKTV